MVFKLLKILMYLKIYISRHYFFVKALEKNFQQRIRKNLSKYLIGLSSTRTKWEIIPQAESSFDTNLHVTTHVCQGGL